jgi:IS4 transposase
VLEQGAMYVIYRGYLDFVHLYTFTQNLCSFITRVKSNFNYARISYRPVDKSTGLRCNQTIRLAGYYTSQDYPAVFRRISYVDPDTNTKLTLLTNNFALPALTIAKLYKYRWKIELFFKWIKQYLRIKSFFGNNVNAVKTQIWITISVYVLVAIVKKELKLEMSLAEILQILSITLFEQAPMEQVLMNNASQNVICQSHKQLYLFNL